jgi:hypothetical protein
LRRKEKDISERSSRMLAHPIYPIVGLVGAKVTAVIGLYCGVKDKDVLNMDAEDWFGLSAIYALFIIASLTAQVLMKMEEKEQQSALGEAASSSRVIGGMV